MSLFRLRAACITVAAWALGALAPAGPAAADRTWISPHYRSHELTGTIWSGTGRKVSEEELSKAVSQATYVLLGETHTNPDHHLLQARLIAQIVKGGRRPAVVMEMIPRGLQTVLDSHLEDKPGDAAGLSAVLKWEERGWPDWKIYEPITQTALDAGLRLVAGDLDKQLIREVAARGAAALDDALAKQIGLDRALEPELETALTKELKKSHCNLQPDRALAPMVKVQRARDGAFAEAMIANAGPDGAILIAGGGHVRNDWAVPRSLRLGTPGASVVSVAFMEVEPGLSQPGDYVPAPAGGEAPFDFIYFTPRADLTDHCAGLKEQMRKKTGTRTD